MYAFVVLALIAPSGQTTKPKEPPAKAGEVVPFGIPAESEYYWPTHLFESPDVRKHLKLTTEQLGHIDAIRAELK